MLNACNFVVSLGFFAFLSLLTICISVPRCFEFWHFDLIDSSHCLLKKLGLDLRRPCKKSEPLPCSKANAVPLGYSWLLFSASVLQIALRIRRFSFAFIMTSEKESKPRASRPQKGGIEMELKALTIFLQPAAFSFPLLFFIHSILFIKISVEPVGTDTSGAMDFSPFN